MPDRRQPFPATPSVPPAALWLGVAGLIPFAAAAAAAHALPPMRQGFALQALAAYGAVILSFLGGVHWGMAMKSSGQAPLFSRLLLSVLPSLLGWAALLLPIRPGLGLLVLGFAAMLAIDWHLSDAPGWYRRLRLPLSAGAILSLLVGLAA